MPDADICQSVIAYVRVVILAKHNSEAKTLRVVIDVLDEIALHEVVRRGRISGRVAFQINTRVGGILDNVVLDSD